MTNTHEQLRKLFQVREEQQEIIRDAQSKKRDTEHKFMEVLIDNQMFDCFKIDFKRLEREIYNYRRS